MPTYAYRCETCGRTDECVARMGKQPKRLTCECGKRMDRDYQAEFGHVPTGASCWPQMSIAMGTNDPVRQRKHDESLGVTCEFGPRGEAIFTSRSHRRKYAEAHGFFDRDGGYSDPQRR